MLTFRRGALLACALMFSLLLGGCAALEPHTLTVVNQPHAEAWTRPLSAEPLRQTFILPHNQRVGEIELILALAADAPAPPTRPLTWQIVTANNAVLRQGVLETAGYLHNTPLRLTFEPIPAGESIELALTAPPDAQLALWRTVEDRYAQGVMRDAPSFSESPDADLTFTLRARETPATLPGALALEAQEWESAARWLPLVLLAPGLAALWLLGNGEGRPRAAAAVGLSLALIPLLYLWFALVKLHLYLPLARSLLAVAAALTLFVMIRRWRWLREAWLRVPIGAVTLLAFALVLSIVTWLMAARDYLAPPGSDMLESGLLAQQIAGNGIAPLPAPPLPPAALAALFSTLTQDEAGVLLLFCGLLLGVAALPALFALGEEITETGELAVWLLPLAWLWQGLWNALAAGDWFALYSYALMPVAVAMGLRALRVRTAVRRALALAAIPLAALFLAQGLPALLAWGVAVHTALLLRSTPVRQEGEPPPAWRALLLRALAWLFMSVTFLMPTLIQRLPVLSPPARSFTALGYEYLLLAIALSLLLRWLRPRLKPFTYYAYALIALLLLGMTWWRAAPLPPAALSLQPDEQNVLTWMNGRNTPAAAQSLINMEVRARRAAPVDGTFWSPVFNNRPTTYTHPPESPDLLQRALAPGALADANLRDELRRAGITHVLLGAARGPLRAADLQNQTWARLAYQSGGAYLFELVANDPSIQ